MSNSPKNNDAIVTLVTKRLNGVQKYLKADKVEIPVQGEMLKPASLIKLYQTSLDAHAAVAAGHATYQGALKDRDDAEPARLAADESLKAWVLARFGAGSTEATELGFAPRRRAVVSVDTRAAALQQSKATRVARGTKGKKEKLQIKGVVPTSTAPAAPATISASAPGAQTLVALPALLTTAAAAPSAQVAAGSVAPPPPTVEASTPPPAAVAVAPAPAAVAVTAAPVTHS